MIPFIWNKFSDDQPTECGDYWVYDPKAHRKSNVFMMKFNPYCGWSSGFGYIGYDKRWTHWKRIRKPKAPKT